MLCISLPVKEVSVDIFLKKKEKQAISNRFFFAYKHTHKRSDTHT